MGARSYTVTRSIGPQRTAGRRARLSERDGTMIETAFQAGADAYVTGEAGVSTREHAREAGTWPEAQRRQGRAQEPQRQAEPSKQKQQSQGPPQGRTR